MTLYMGFMLLIIACALLALQFLTQMQSTKSRYLTLSILGARREQCDIISDGGNAVSAIRAQNPNVILLDFLLPNLDGLATRDSCVDHSIHMIQITQNLCADSRIDVNSDMQ